MAEKNNSSATWYGIIPEEWKLSKISSIFELRTTKVSDEDYEPLSVTMQGIVPQLESAAKTNAHDDRKLVKKGDFAINSRSDRRGSCGISGYDGSVSLINTVMKPRDEMNPDYYNWLFQTTQFADEFYKWGHGIVDDLWTTNWQDMKNIDIPMPSLEEQKNIADFLNGLIPEIDTLYSDIEKQIETLEDYKKAIITHAVTKGLNPNVEMKDSGIEWIGKIPVNWGLYRVKNVATLKTGSTPSGNDGIVYYDEKECFKWITPGDMSDNNYLISKSQRFITKDAIEKYKLKIYPSNSLLIVGIGATVGKIGLCEEEVYSNQQITAVIPRSITSKYLLYLLVIASDYVRDNALYTTLPILNNSYLGNVKIVMPSKNEQQEIADYLDAKCAEINDVINNKKKQLEILEEYKKTLIYEYITGKKEVPTDDE